MPDPNGEIFAAPAEEVTVFTPDVRSTVTGPATDAYAKAMADLTLLDKMRDFVLKTTRPSDWHMFGERPWPQRGAVEKISRGLGLNVKIHVGPDGKRYTKHFSQDEQGSYYVITVTGTIYSERWGSLEAMGFTTSRDQFFAYSGGELKPAHEVKEENIIQAAYTNFIANAVMRYTGISGYTKADLDRVFGEGQVSQHAYNQSSQKKTVGSTAEITAKRLKLRAICLTMTEGVESEAALLLIDMSKFTGKDNKEVPGAPRVDKLTDGRVVATLKTAEKRWEEFLQKAGEQRGFYEGLLESRMKPAAEGPPSGGVQ